MIVVNFYAFEKLKNSTKQPEAPAISYQCELKGGCSLTAPVLRVRNNKPFTYNYCYIPDFNRYYFIRDWAWDAGIWVASCEVDVLASWKSEIGNSTEYVVRCASHFDGNINDGIYPTTNEFTQNWVDGSGLIFHPPSSDFSGGYFILGVMGVGTAGSAVYYALTSSQLGDLVTYMYDNPNAYLDNPDDFELGEDLLRVVFNPAEYILSCVWVPLDAEDLGHTTLTDITIGWWKTSVQGRKLISLAGKRSVSFTVPSHPQSYRGNYLNYSPYSTYTIYVPAIGASPVPPEIAVSGSVTITLSWDIMTGSVAAFILGPGEEPIPIGTGDFGVSVPLSAIRSGKLSLLAQGVATIAGGALGGLLGFSGSGMDEVAKGFSSAVSAAFPPKATTVGSATGYAAMYGMPIAWLYCVFQHIVEEDNEHLGRPYCRKIQISECSGFVMCRDANITLSSTAEERAEIVSAMNSGFIYE